ncbi:MAG TPA: inositol monophosphatase family protein [Candidatus Eremiobacteraceae bacterium]|nr:inositol monophosphatase family protein [Candidatus Eremiobacteraceae bacterium]
MDVASRAAREAGALLRSMLGTEMHVRSKDVRTNLVTDADTKSEKLIRSILSEAFHGEAFLGEETGSSGDPSRGRWIVDPLDGTTNYAHGYRCFSVSIAFEREGVVELGCVFDPMADELFSAERGSGATCNGGRIRVSSCDDASAAMLVTGFPAHRVDDPLSNIHPFGDFLQITRAIRRDGSAALDLCYVACGRFDGFWEPGLHAWDVAAGALICTEAGGRVSGYRGEAFSLDGGRLVASNGKIHDRMIEVVAKYA